jgi:phosphoglucosamine mutase
VALLADEGGAVVSASHNPPEYNGVKFLWHGGKLTDPEEEQVEALLDEEARDGGSSRVVSGLDERYRTIICERFGRPLDGLRIAVDCANGALSEIGPKAFTELGAKVVPVGVDPDGRNINAGCGATDLALLSRVVRERSLDLGVAFDGDGDRVLAVDDAGREVDGVQILSVLAPSLGVDLVAVTVMSNLGLHRFMEERGIRVVTTAVGDRYVLEALLREGGMLGGEQSGHVIWLDGHVSGDGLAAALLLCGAVIESGTPLADLVRLLVLWPQVKASVRVRSRILPESITENVRTTNARLDGHARLLVRPSGTEPVVRILAEAESEQEARELCGRMASLVERELG